MIVLDTNVISEIFRPSPEPRVVEWLVYLTGDVAITSITLAELLAGVRRLPDGRRKDQLAQGIEEAVAPYRWSRSVLAFDADVAERYAEVLAARDAAGMPIGTADAQIAEICLAHEAVCATRNANDFQYSGVKIVDPWSVEA